MGFPRQEYWSGGAIAFSTTEERGPQNPEDPAGAPVASPELTPGLTKMTQLLMSS